MKIKKITESEFINLCREEMKSELQKIYANVSEFIDSGRDEMFLDNLNEDMFDEEKIGTLIGEEYQAEIKRLMDKYPDTLKNIYYSELREDDWDLFQDTVYEDLYKKYEAEGYDSIEVEGFW